VAKGNWIVKDESGETYVVNEALTTVGECDAKISRGSRAMKKRNFAVGQHVRLKWALEAPTNIPVGAIGEVTRVSPWDVWVRFDKRVVRLPAGEVDHL
jgi:hypothetical protein